MVDGLIRTNSAGMREPGPTRLLAARLIVAEAVPSSSASSRIIVPLSPGLRGWRRRNGPSTAGPVSIDKTFLARSSKSTSSAGLFGSRRAVVSAYGRRIKSGQSDLPQMRYIIRHRQRSLRVGQEMQTRPHFATKVS